MIICGETNAETAKGVDGRDGVDPRSRSGHGTMAATTRRIRWANRMTSRPAISATGVRIVGVAWAKPSAQSAVVTATTARTCRVARIRIERSTNMLTPRQAGVKRYSDNTPGLWPRFRIGRINHVTSPRKLRPISPATGGRPSTAREPADALNLDHLLKTTGPDDLDRLTQQLISAGVEANRWTSPDLLAQLSAAAKRPIDLILCNGLDSDTALPLQQTVAREYAREIVAAVAILGAATGAKRQLIALDSAHPDAIGEIEHSTAGTKMRTVKLTNRYPQQNPTLLLYTVARRRLSPGLLPTEVGALVFDVIAAAAIGTCFLSGERPAGIPVGIADMRRDATGERVHLLSVPAGTKLEDIFSEVGIAPGPMEIRSSSPLREIILNRCDPVMVGGEAAIYLVDPHPAVDPDPCIRCGWCVSGCPVHIQPAGILHAAQLNDRAMAERYGIESCIECGICSYVCPSHLPLLRGIRSLSHVPDAI